MSTTFSSMRLNAFFLIIFFISYSFQSFSQEKSYRVVCVGFYNVENLFDTLDTPGKVDEYFTPEGSNGWSQTRYNEKLERIAGVIAEIGTEKTPDGLAILGLCEVENRQVVEDLITEPALKDRNYQIIHVESPDERGIDVALIYQPQYFSPNNTLSVPLILIDESGERNYTRDQLVVSGELDGEAVNIIVNHWPSRSGGEQRSRPFRNAAANLCRQIVDSLMITSPQAKTIVMGDLNDDPTNESCKIIMRGRRKPEQVSRKDFYNPMFELYKKGFGTLAYRDSWSLFDQIMLSQNFLRGRTNGFFYFQTGIYNPKYLQQKSGAFKGYPYRTYVGPNYMGGYSDHFPVYVYLLREL